MQQGSRQSERPLSRKIQADATSTAVRSSQELKSRDVSTQPYSDLLSTKVAFFILLYKRVSFKLNFSSRGIFKRGKFSHCMKQVTAKQIAEQMNLQIKPNLSKRGYEGKRYWNSLRISVIGCRWCLQTVIAIADLLIIIRYRGNYVRNITHELLPRAKLELTLRFINVLQSGHSKLKRNCGFLLVEVVHHLSRTTFSHIRAVLNWYT